MAHTIIFQHEQGWRKNVRIIEKPRDNDTWEVLTLNERKDEILLRLGDAHRYYRIREWLSNEKFRADLYWEKTDLE